jgi:ATP-dependent DNA helicase RecG
MTESATTEYKREYTPNINKTIIAFANTSGGTLFIGIANDGNTVGVADIDATMLRVSNSIRDSIKPDVTLFVDYQQETIDGETVIKVVVQKGTSCPYYLTGKGIRPEGVYVRQGTSTVPATETAILRMIKETDGEKYENVRALNQELTFIEATKEFKAQNISFEASQQKTLGLMNTDGIYTNLGLLISDQCVHTVKLAVFEGTVKVAFKDRREFTGSLLKQLNDIYEFIDRYNRNRSEIYGLHRTDKRDYPAEAVREALLNALVHRDYSFSDSTLISIFDDRIEFTSIGGLVKGISFDDMILGISVARNRNLANVFYRLTLIEAYGTGMPKIIQSYDNYAAKPQIEVTDNAFKITLPNNNETPKKPSLSENEYSVLDLFKEKKFVLRKDVEAALSVSQAMAVRVLKGLSGKGAIQVVGSGKNTRYIKSDTSKILQANNTVSERGNGYGNN